MHKTSITLVLSFIQERESTVTGILTHIKRKPNVEAVYERGAILQYNCPIKQTALLLIRAVNLTDLEYSTH